MKAIVLESLTDATALIAEINTYVGSIAIKDPVESDEGWVVLVPKIADSMRTLDLPSMIVDKKFIPPVVVVDKPMEPGLGTLA